MQCQQKTIFQCLPGAATEQMGGGGEVLDFYVFHATHRRKINTEGNATVVASVWGGKNLFHSLPRLVERH